MCWETCCSFDVINGRRLGVMSSSGEPQRIFKMLLGWFELSCAAIGRPLWLRIMWPRIMWPRQVSNYFVLFLFPDANSCAATRVTCQALLSQQFTRSHTVHQGNVHANANTPKPYPWACSRSIPLLFPSIRRGTIWKWPNNATFSSSSGEVKSLNVTYLAFNVAAC